MQTRMQYALQMDFAEAVSAWIRDIVCNVCIT
jgi:hypothetical protein